MKPTYKLELCHECYLSLMARLGRCANCSFNPSHQGRPLCKQCGQVPAVVAKYEGGPQPEPKGPSHRTLAKPGSEEKILVMQARAALLLNLHHPDDIKEFKDTSVIEFFIRPLKFHYEDDNDSPFESLLL